MILKSHEKLCVVNSLWYILLTEDSVVAGAVAEGEAAALVGSIDLGGRATGTACDGAKERSKESQQQRTELKASIWLSIYMPWQIYQSLTRRDSTGLRWGWLLFGCGRWLLVHLFGQRLVCELQLRCESRKCYGKISKLAEVV